MQKMYNKIKKETGMKIDIGKLKPGMEEEKQGQFTPVPKIKKPYPSELFKTLLIEVEYLNDKRRQNQWGWKELKDYISSQANDPKSHIATACKAMARISMNEYHVEVSAFLDALLTKHFSWRSIIAFLGKSATWISAHKEYIENPVSSEMTNEKEIELISKIMEMRQQGKKIAEIAGAVRKSISYVYVRLNPRYTPERTAQIIKKGAKKTAPIST